MSTELDPPALQLPVCTIEPMEQEGDYQLYMGNTRVAMLKTTEKRREIHWQVYGPMDLARARVMIEGLLHLSALVNTPVEARIERDEASNDQVHQPPRKWQKRRRTTA